MNGNSGFQYTIQPYVQYWRHSQNDNHAYRQTNWITKAEADFKATNRLLWEQHIAWTRMTIISLVFNLPDLKFVVARLLQNATHMGNSIRPYYGDMLAEQYSALIKEHLLIAADLVKAALAKNAQLTAETEQKWYKNADDISVFLSSINPYLSLEEVKKMFYEHLDLTKIEAVCMIIKNFEADVAVYDKIELAALMMADAISEAIIKQFPNKFV